MSVKAKSSVPRSTDRIVVFQEKTVRRTWHRNEWWFSVRDVVAVLTRADDRRVADSASNFPRQPARRRT